MLILLNWLIDWLIDCIFCIQIISVINCSDFNKLFFKWYKTKKKNTKRAKGLRGQHKTEQESYMRLKAHSIANGIKWKVFLV